MTRIGMSIVGAALILATPAVSFAGEDQPAPASPNGSAQMSDKQIRDQLTQDGYTVRTLKHEGADRVIAIATDDRGTTSKLVVDAKTGVATPATDDDDD